MPRRERGTPATYQSTPWTEQEQQEYMIRNADAIAQDLARVAQGRRSRIPHFPPLQTMISVPIHQQNPINNPTVLNDECEDPK